MVPGGAHVQVDRVVVHLVDLGGIAGHLFGRNWH